MIFRDRVDAGLQLIPPLEKFRAAKKTIVLGLARGGVVVASEIAKGLKLPLNVLCPRKIGAPGNPELAVGAIMEEGEGVYNEDILRYFPISSGYLERERDREREVIRKRLAVYRAKHPLPPLEGYTAIVVDDGIATGATMQAAIEWLRLQDVANIVVAVPVAAASSLEEVKSNADEVVCLYHPHEFGAVGYFYQDFDQTSDDEVLQLLG